jgi:hypothetical protein
LADLLIMSALDLNAPPAPVDGGDLMDALVQDDLDRTASPAPVPPMTAPNDEVATLSEAAEADPSALPAAPPTEDDHAQLLQREIELLLKGPAAPPPPAAPDDHAPPPAGPAPAAEILPLPDPTFSPAGPALFQRPSDSAAISPAELQTLVPTAQFDPATSPAFPAGGAGEMFDTTERQLTDAEDTLAAELAQLMADAQTDIDRQLAGGSEAPAAAPAPVPERPAEVPAVAAAVTPPAPPVSPPFIPAPAPPAAPAEPATPPAPAAATTSFEPAVAPAAPAAAPRPSLLNRLWRLLCDVALMIAQLIDLPFAWVHDMDKNVIGFAAVLLLLSGVVMYVLAWVYQ